MKSIISETIEISAQFYDLDPMEVVWHGNYPRFFELARTALMNRIGYGYKAMRESGFAWPVVDLHVRYFQPVVMDQPAQVTVELVEWENRLKFRYLIRDQATGRKMTAGHTVQVAVEISSRELQWETPRALREKLCPYLD